MTSGSALASSMICLSASNSPRYMVPATTRVRSRLRSRRRGVRLASSPDARRWLEPSTMAVLPHARFAQEHRIVLGAAAEDLDDPLGFAVAADDRIGAFRLGEFAGERRR